MAFIPANPGTGTDHSAQELVLLGNSVTLNVGDTLETESTGYGLHATAATPFLGVIVAFVNFYDAPLTPTAYAAGTATGTTVDSVVTASNNTTTKTYYAVVETSTKVQFSAAINGTLGTTVSSTLRGCRIDVDSANSNYGRLLETTATRTVSTLASFYSHGVDPNDSTRLIVSIAAPEASGKY